MNLSLMPTSVFYPRSEKKNPTANNICALGSMNEVEPGSKWPGYIEKAVTRITRYFLLRPHQTKKPVIGKNAQKSVTADISIFVGMPYKATDFIKNLRFKESQQCADINDHTVNFKTVKLLIY